MSLIDQPTLLTAIQNWLQRPDLTALFPDFITLFETAANRRLRVSQQETTVQLPPVLGVITLPADYLTWRRVTWTGNPRRELTYAEPSWVQAMFPDGPTDVPSVFTIEAGSLKIMPTDSTNTVVELVYWAKIPSLTTTNPTNWLMTAHPDLYLWGSLTEAQAYAVNTDMAVLWKTRRDEVFDEIDKLDKKSRGPSSVRTTGPTP